MLLTQRIETPEMCCCGIKHTYMENISEKKANELILGFPAGRYINEKSVLKDMEMHNRRMMKRWNKKRSTTHD